MCRVKKTSCVMLLIHQFETLLILFHTVFIFLSYLRFEVVSVDRAHSSMVEYLFCIQVALGSSPSVSIVFDSKCLDVSCFLCV